MNITESKFVIESHNNKPLKALTKKQAEYKINIITGELYLFKNSEREILEIENILRLMNSEKISPEKALIEASQILEIKNSYTKMYRSFLKKICDIITELY